MHLSLGQPTFASSHLNNSFLSNFMVDGDPRPGGIFRTLDGDTTPWFAVDLGTTSVVSRMVIYNRDDCCGKRLSHSQIRFFNGSSVPVSGPAGPITSGQLVWTQAAPIAQGSAYAINLDPPAVGRFLTLQNFNPSKNAHEVLRLC